MNVQRRIETPSKESAGTLAADLATKGHTVTVVLSGNGNYVIRWR